MNEELPSKERMSKYSSSCCWCHARISFDEVPRIDAYMCPSCNEFFAIDKIDYLTQEIVAIKIDTLLSFQS